jgi:hypothetical protein
MVHDRHAATDKVKRAVEWISLQKKMTPALEFKAIINEAIFKFDLTPKESEFLYSFYKINT